MFFLGKVSGVARWRSSDGGGHRIFFEDYQRHQLYDDRMSAERPIRYSGANVIVLPNTHDRLRLRVTSSRLHGSSMVSMLSRGIRSTIIPLRTTRSSPSICTSSTP